MSDLKRYIEKRTTRDPEFAENYEKGYLEFKLGVLLRQAREEAGLTQEDVALKLKRLIRKSPTPNCTLNKKLYGFQN